MKTGDISIFSLLMCIESPPLPPNRAIILIGLVVENPLAVEDGQYLLGKVLRLQMSSTITYKYMEPLSAKTRQQQPLEKHDTSPSQDHEPDKQKKKEKFHAEQYRIAWKKVKFI